MNSEKKQNQSVRVSHCRLITECSRWWIPVLQHDLSLKNTFPSYSKVLWMTDSDLWIFRRCFPKVSTWRLEIMFCFNSKPSSALMLIGRSRTGKARKETVWRSASCICFFKLPVTLRSISRQSALQHPLLLFQSQVHFWPSPAFQCTVIYLLCPCERRGRGSQGEKWL